MRCLGLCSLIALLLSLTCCITPRGEECTLPIECNPGTACMTSPEGMDGCGETRRCLEPCEQDSDCCDECECHDVCDEGGMCVVVGSAG